MRTLLFATFLVLSITSFSQDHRYDQIQALKVSFITQKVDLSPQQAQEFWPIYNQMSAEIEALRAKRKSAFKAGQQQLKSQSDEQIEALIQLKFQTEEKELIIRKAYHNKFKAVLEMHQIAELYIAEKEFKRHLIERLKRSGKS